MEITEVKIYMANEDRLRAYVTIVWDDCFVIRDIKIIQGDSSLFVAMPSKRGKDGSFKDIAHPLNHETRKFVENKILEAYQREVGKSCPAAITAS